MHPDRQVVRRHALKYRAKLWGRERLARDVGEDLNTARAQTGHGTIELGPRGVDIVHGQRCDESRESAGMPTAELSERGVRQARELGGLVGRSNELEPPGV